MDIDLEFDSLGMGSDYKRLLGPTWETTEVDRIQNRFQKFCTGKKEKKKKISTQRVNYIVGMNR